MRKFHYASVISSRWTIVSLLVLFMLLALIVRLFNRNLPWMLELIEISCFVIFLIYYLKGNYIVTTSDGLEYHRRDYMISTKWDDVDRIETIRIGYRLDESLILRHSTLTQKTKDIIWLMHPEYVSKFIPLSAFSQPWRKSELGEEIQKYAPNLF